MLVRYVLEDLAHAEFVPALFRRIARDVGVDVDERIPGYMSGAGTTISELRQLLGDINAGVTDRPDLIVVGIDADCGQQGDRERQVERACELEHYQGTVLTAEPDPHIEIWYLSDPVFVQQLQQTLERPSVPTVRCKRQEYKDRLRSTVLSSGVRPALGGIEYGTEIAERMDLYRAGRNVSSLKRFVDAARGQCAVYRRRPS